MNPQRFINSLSIKTEIPLYLLSFPYFINFSIFATTLETDLLIRIAVSGTIISILPLIAGYLLRRKKLMPLLKKIQLLSETEIKLDEGELKKIKKALILHPRWEGRIIVLRWTFAIFGFLGFATPVFGLTNQVVFVLSYACIMMIPIIYLTYYFQSEIQITKVLKIQDLVKTELNLKELPVFSIFKRNLFIQIGIVILPIMTLSYYLFAYYHKWIELPNLWIQIPFIIIMMMAIIFYMAVVGNNALKEDILNLNESIAELSNGNLEKEIPVISNTNLNPTIYKINSFINRLNQYFSTVHNESDKVKSTSQSLKSHSVHVNSEIEKEVESVNLIAGAVSDINTFSNQILDTISNQTERIGNLDLDLTKIANSMQELSEKSNQLSETAKKSVEHSEATNIVMSDAIEKVTQLVESNKNINETIRIVEEISDQINLLSLNASIEAARAGEYGRGFAVVAQEVARLADKTQENIDQIKKVMKKSNTYSQASMEAMKSIHDSFIAYRSDTDVIAKSITHFSSTSQTNSDEVNKAKFTISDIGDKGKDISKQVVEQWNKTAEINSLLDDMQEISSDIMKSFQELKNLSTDIESIAGGLDENLRGFKTKI